MRQRSLDTHQRNVVTDQLQVAESQRSLVIVQLQTGTNQLQVATSQRQVDLR